MNFKHKRCLAIIDQIIAGEMRLLVIAHKEQLARFGCSLVEHVCTRARYELLMMKSERVSPEQERVQDLMTIMHCFSSRLYGLQNNGQSLKKMMHAHR